MLILPIQEHGRFSHLLFLFSMVWSFPWRGHSHPFISLFLGIFFWGYCKCNCFSIFFLNLFIVGVQKGYCFCELILFPATFVRYLWCLGLLWSSFSGLWAIRSYCLWIGIV
jgi:hypothetical protein